MTDSIPSPYNAALVLSSGDVLYGYGIGAAGTAMGEICFNTGMTGYQETLSDPSYCAQIITFTFPHIGNVGTNIEDMESADVAAAGLIVREAITPASNFRAEDGLDTWLKAKQVTGISGIDTRALTRLIRMKGAQNVAIVYPEAAQALDMDAVRAKLAAHPSLKGLELTCRVSTPNAYEWQQTDWQLGQGYGKAANLKRHVVAIDYGEKYNILRLLAAHDCKVTVVPANMNAEDLLALAPDGVFLSNGPGDPSATSVFAAPVIQAVINAGIPLFGICLGHQLLALAVGAKTEKMHQGHRGANQPVQQLATGAVEITSQNHGFEVLEASLPANARATHRSLFDGSLEGFELTDKPAFAVQYHPESSPGPHDSRYLFEQFMQLIDQHPRAAA